MAAGTPEVRVALQLAIHFNHQHTSPAWEIRDKVRIIESHLRWCVIIHSTSRLVPISLSQLTEGGEGEARRCPLYILILLISLQIWPKQILTITLMATSAMGFGLWPQYWDIYLVRYPDIEVFSSSVTQIFRCVCRSCSTSGLPLRWVILQVHGLASFGRTRSD